MVEQLKPVIQPKQPTPDASATAQRQTPDTVVAPLEIKSLGNGICVIIDQKSVVIELAPQVAEEIGSYRRCKMIKVKYMEGGGIQILPVGL